MSAEHSFPGKQDRPATFMQSAGQAALACGVVVVVFAVWMANLPGAANWPGLYRVMPRLSIFALGVFAALAVQCRRTNSLALAAGGLLALIGMLALQNWALLFEVFKLQPDAVPLVAGGKALDWTAAGGDIFFHARTDMLGPGTAVLLMRFECALFAAIFLGTWMGRGVKLSWHFLALLAFAAVSDGWLNHMRVAESVDFNDPLAALRLPFLPALGRITVAPAFTDIFFMSAALEASRLFRIHTFWIVLAAISGYLSGSLFGHEPLLSMPLAAMAMIFASWPHIKVDSTALGKMFLSVALLIMTLVALIALRLKLNPPPPRIMREPEQLRSVAVNREIEKPFAVREPSHVIFESCDRLPVQCIQRNSCPMTACSCSRWIPFAGTCSSRLWKTAPCPRSARF